MTTLTLQDLTKIYRPGITAVSSLNLSVKEGELLVLLGPSGCGKTTTLRLIAGLLPPTSGDVLFDGHSVLAMPPQQRGAVMVFQQDALFPFMSVGENVAFGLKMRQLAREEIEVRVAQALAAVHLPEAAAFRPDQLSGGERQRVGLARALVVRPKILLLDEPLNQLDSQLRSGVRQMILHLQKEMGITTLFVTHDQAEAVEMADRIALLIDGRLRQVGPPQAFFENPLDAQVARFFGASNFIPGIKEGPLVQTRLGPIEVPGQGQADGPVTLTIRPEAIEIGANGHNNFQGRVQSSRYTGPAAQVQVKINGVQLHLLTLPFEVPGPSENIEVHLPRERIIVLAHADAV